MTMFPAWHLLIRAEDNLRALLNHVAGTPRMFALARTIPRFSTYAQDQPFSVDLVAPPA
jgi:hypothetical protein